LLLAVAMLLVSCKGKGEEDGTTATPSGSAAAVEWDLKDFKIVRGDEASEFEARAAGTFRMLMMDQKGATLDIGTDYVKKGTTLTGEEKEILIGETNRPESAQVKALCTPGGYAIAAVNNKLVIIGYDAFMTLVAVEAFFTDVLQGEKTTMMSDLSHTFTAAPISLSEGEWTVVRSYDDPAKVTTAAADLRQKLKEVTGKDVKYSSDNKEASANEILVGNTNRSETEYVKQFVTEYGYLIRVINGKIVIIGGSANTIALGVEMFTQELLNAGKTTLEVGFGMVMDNIYMPTMADSHTVKENTDDSRLDALYAAFQTYVGDPHMHSSTGPKGDGSSTLAQLREQAEVLGLDFLMCCDHRQTTHVDDVDWDTTFFISSTEPGTRLADEYNAEFHYMLYAPTPEAYKQIFRTYATLFNYNGQTFSYPRPNSATFRELVAYVQSLGGNLVILHPMNYGWENESQRPTEPLYFYYGEGTLFEVIYTSTAKSKIQDNYNMWSGMLMEGKKVYATAGTDTHTTLYNNGSLATLWASERDDGAFVESMNSGRFCAGVANIRMAIDDTLMGGTTAFSEGQKLYCSVSDVQTTVKKIRIRVYTDKGIAYEAEVDPKVQTNFEIDVQDRSFYRIEVSSIGGGDIYALGQPIWLS